MIEVNDRVKTVRGEPLPELPLGSIGTIVKITPSAIYPFLVCFDDKPNREWPMQYDELEKI